jgi:hypothetical protein
MPVGDSRKSQNRTVTGGFPGNNESTLVANVPSTQSLFKWHWESMCMGGKWDVLWKRKEHKISVSDMQHQQGYGLKEGCCLEGRFPNISVFICLFCRTWDGTQGLAHSGQALHH